MDGESVFVSPAEVFSSISGMDLKTVVAIHPPSIGDNDDKFARYDSSPESMMSYSDDMIFSPIEDGHGMPRGDLLDMVTPCLQPFQDHANPSSTTFPISLNALDEHLITTYLTDFSEKIYGFHPDLIPHPLAAVLSLAMTNPACFHLILAHSAQYQRCWNQFHSAKQQRELDVAMMRHRGEALQLIRGLSQTTGPGQHAEDLIAAITGLGMIDRFSGDESTASMHDGAIRQLLKSIGGAARIQSPWLSRILVHFECGYGTSTESYLWDRSDFAGLHRELNQFFNTSWLSRRSSASKHSPTCSRGSGDQKAASKSLRQHGFLALRPNSPLYKYLSRRPENTNDPTQGDRRELVFQLSSLFILCAVMLDHPSDPRASEAFVDSIHQVFDATTLRDQSPNNLTWLLQVRDLSDLHARRIWDVSGWVWVLRHVSFNVQGMVRDWLVAVLTGQPVGRALKLDSFAFSYAS